MSRAAWVGSTLSGQVFVFASDLNVVLNAGSALGEPNIVVGIELIGICVVESCLRQANEPGKIK